MENNDAIKYKSHEFKRITGGLVGSPPWKRQVYAIFCNYEGDSHELKHETKHLHKLFDCATTALTEYENLTSEINKCNECLKSVVKEVKEFKKLIVSAHLPNDYIECVRSIESIARVNCEQNEKISAGESRKNFIVDDFDHEIDMLFREGKPEAFYFYERDEDEGDWHGSYINVIEMLEQARWVLWNIDLIRDDRKDKSNRVNRIRMLVEKLRKRIDIGGLPQVFINAWKRLNEASNKG